MTIQEMAQIWLAARLLNGSSGSLSVEEFRELGMDAYMAGAKAVLEEIEKIMELKWDEVSTYESIQDKIKELRG